MYLSNVDSTIINTKIIGNHANNESSTGRAIYLDDSITYVENSKIENNTGGGVYAYDSKLIVENTTFSNNYEAIHCVFLNHTLENNDFGNDTLFLNDTYYIDYLEGTGLGISLINNTIDVETLPSRYDLRDWGWVSSVGNQGDMGACSSFASLGALESALLKSTGITYDFSKNNMQNLMLLYSKYGVTLSLEGAGSINTVEYLISWLGPISEKEDTFDELGKLSPLIVSNETIHVHDVIIMGHLEYLKDHAEIKKAIMNYGALHSAYYADHNDSFFNEETAAYYTNCSYFLGFINENVFSITIIKLTDIVRLFDFLEGVMHMFIGFSDSQHIRDVVF